jgi:uncharacterized membrane protein
VKLKTTDLLSAGAIVSLLALAAYLYPSLPDPLPTRWNTSGAVSGYAPKTWGIVMLVGLPAVVFVVMKILPAISPRGFRMDAFQRVTDILTATLTWGLAGIGAVALLAATGRPVPMQTAVMLFAGVMCLVLGNYLGKVRKNFFIGIRTPWTLASDEVWARTHRFGGWTFAVGGVVLLVVAWDPAWFPRGLAIIAAGAALVPAVYSFVVYRRLHGSGAA